MRPVHTVLLALTLGMTAAAQDAREHTITPRELVVGDVMVEGLEGDLSLEQTVTFEDTEETMSMASTITIKHRWTVLEVDDKGVSKVRFEVLEHKEDDTADGETRSEVNPHAGKTFIITRGEGGVKVSPVGDFEVDSRINREVLDSLHDLEGALVSPAAGLESLIARKTFVEGKVVDVPLEDVHRFLGSVSDQIPIDSIRFTPREARSSLGAACVVFDIAATLSETEDGMSVSVDATGELVVRKSDGFVQSLSFGGPISMTGSDGDQKMTGTGKMEIELLSFFEKKTTAEKK